MNVLFDEFLPEVLPDVPGCPDISAIIAIRNAAIEFCERSHFWKSALGAFSTEANAMTYNLVSPVTGTRVIQVRDLFLDGAEIRPRTEEWLDQNSLDWRTAGSKPRFYFQPSPEQITLASLPDAAYALTGTVSLCPKRTATGIERFVYENHLETIASGAKSRLMMAPGKAWSNPQLGQYHAGLFNSGVTSANVNSAKGLSRAPIRTTSYNR